MTIIINMLLLWLVVRSRLEKRLGNKFYLSFVCREFRSLLSELANFTFSSTHSYPRSSSFVCYLQLTRHKIIFSSESLPSEVKVKFSLMIFRQKWERKRRGRMSSGFSFPILKLRRPVFLRQLPRNWDFIPWFCFGLPSSQEARWRCYWPEMRDDEGKINTGPMCGRASCSLLDRKINKQRRIFSMSKSEVGEIQWKLRYIVNHSLIRKLIMNDYGLQYRQKNSWRERRDAILGSRRAIKSLCGI